MYIAGEVYETTLIAQDRTFNGLSNTVTLKINTARVKLGLS